MNLRAILSCHRERIGDVRSMNSPMNAESDPFELQFDTTPLHAIDDIALLATQRYNLGDRGRWFLCFRKGCQGFGVRLYAVSIHYSQLHSWQLRCRWHQEPEYHLASIFFGLESALECFLYSLNALGYGSYPDEFVDITTDKGLRSLGPWIMLGSPSRKPLDACSKYFPRVTGAWKEHKALIEEIQRQHDVSKHRSTTYVGGISRGDVPPGFYEALGISESDPRRFDFAPMGEVILDPDPKRPASAPRQDVRYKDLRTLETLCGDFKKFVETMCVEFLADTREAIKLRHDRILERYAVVGDAAIKLYSDPSCETEIPEVQGVRIDWGHGPYPPEKGRVTPASKSVHYPRGARLPIPGKHDRMTKIGPAWYFDQQDARIVQAWSASTLYVSMPLDTEADDTHASVRGKSG